MTKVITYGTYDLLHHGHIRLLRHAKALGDWLIVGVTSDDYDKARGKINVKQSLLERIAAVEATGLADEIIVEEYEGQKIDDIKRYDVKIFTVGSDWEGKFDYLKEYCEVIYLPRTEGISSSDLRAERRAVRLGLVGESSFLVKFKNESQFVNGIEVTGVCTQSEKLRLKILDRRIFVTSQFDELLERVDAVYIISHPVMHFSQIKEALLKGKHVLCESPIAVKLGELEQLLELAKARRLILMEAIKTAYSTAYYRMLLLVKSGLIGQVAAIDATCTSLMASNASKQPEQEWGSICEWGPPAMLPIFQLLGTNYLEKVISSSFAGKQKNFDIFSKIDFLYPNAVASLKVGKGVKSEGELIISGTRGYIYVPAPWWKLDYFEIRYENQSDNRRYFYQLDGDGIRYEIVNFVKSIETGSARIYIEKDVSRAITKVIEDFMDRRNVRLVELG